MNKSRMHELIDSEHGEGFHKNIDLSGYNFYKGDSFISFKILRIKGHNVALVKYIYATKYSELVSLLCFASNYWIAKDVKLIYYKERSKHKYAVEKLQELGFVVKELEVEFSEWISFDRKPRKCDKPNSDKDKVYEAYV